MCDCGPMCNGYNHHSLPSSSFFSSVCEAYCRFVYMRQPTVHSPPAVVVLEQPTGDLLNVFVRNVMMRAYGLRLFRMMCALRYEESFLC